MWSNNILVGVDRFSVIVMKAVVLLAIILYPTIATAKDDFFRSSGGIYSIAKFPIMGYYIVSVIYLVGSY